MLLRIIPQGPFPTVVFHLLFPLLPQDLPLPPNWIMQMNQLVADGLDLPVPDLGIHALDKAAALVVLLQQVEFDMVTGTIACIYLDGTLERWPLADPACVAALESVLFDVHEGGVEAERERRAVAALIEPPAPAQVQPRPVAPPAPAPVKPAKHKKQRSMLLSFVVSLVSSATNSSSSCPQPAPPAIAPVATPIAPVPAPLPPSQTGLSAKHLRRRARSTLVDLYNRHVLGELRARRRAADGYAPWVAQSMLRAVEDQMDWLMRAASATKLDDAPADTDDNARQARGHSREQSSSDTLFDDAGSLAPSLATDDTADVDDDASIRTPVDGTSSDLSLGASSTGGAKTTLAPADLEVYARLAAQRTRLQQLLRAHAFLAGERAAEEGQLLRVLEVKSRRRAWSNRALMLAGSEEAHALRGARVRDCGLGVPVRRSPLGWCAPVCAADLEDINAEEAEAILCSPRTVHAPSPRPRYLSVASGPQDLSALFSVTEDAEDQDQDECAESDFHPARDAGQGPPGLGLGRAVRVRAGADAELEDVEMGLGGLSLRWIPPTPMARTVSSAPAHRDVGPPPPPPYGWSAPLTADSLLCQPLPPPAQALGKGAGLGDCSEFTLAMDLPFPVTMGGSGHGHGHGGGARRVDYDEWLPGLALGCR